MGKVDIYEGRCVEIIKYGKGGCEGGCEGECEGDSEGGYMNVDV